MLNRIKGIKKGKELKLSSFPFTKNINIKNATS